MKTHFGHLEVIKNKKIAIFITFALKRTNSDDFKTHHAHNTQRQRKLKINLKNKQ